MKFQTYQPCEILAPYIRFLAISESPEYQTYKVLPDTSLVMGIQYKGRLSYVSNDKETLLSTAGITGLMDSHRIFKNAAGTGTVLVYFKETGAAAFFEEPLHELFSKSLSLDHFINKSILDVLEDRLSSAESDRQKIDIVENFLISRLRILPKDQLVLSALEFIYQSKGTIRIHELAEKLNISQSPLEKRFRKVVGASPKKFASLVRLNTLVKSPQNIKNLTEKGYEAGYFDQSHFIRDFKKFTGETPETFFQPKG
jgi:AraC-like DNA-binding protein